MQKNGPRENLSINQEENKNLQNPIDILIFALVSISWFQNYAENVWVYTSTQKALFGLTRKYVLQNRSRSFCQVISF